ncbi:MAG: Uma2 family endonuclease [Candidatus Competibacteraceae bacterium]|nr:MAG: Uma2 family endonuclease [Candidatus Competibacteraceae bacterium]
MMPKLREPLTSVEYLVLERESETKNEYFNGETFAMAGASRRHNQITTNLVCMVGNQLANRVCSVYSSDMKVKIDKLNKYTYPDVLIVCQNQQFEDENEDVLLNPVVIMEVLSDSTEAYDRGDKFIHYQNIPSLVEYVLISQKSVQVEKFLRQLDHVWVYSKYLEMGDEIHLTAVDCILTIQEIYAKVISPSGYQAAL